MKTMTAIFLLAVLGVLLVMALVMAGKYVYRWWKFRERRKAPWDTYVDYSQPNFINYYVVRGAGAFGIREVLNNKQEMQHVGTAAISDTDKALQLESEMEERAAFLNSQQRRLLRRVKR